MRFTDNAELTAANMTNTDILAGTDVSEQTDKKFSLAGLADWFLNRFTGLSLAGKNQSVKAALDELNSTFAVENFTSDAVTIVGGGRTGINIPCTKTGYAVVGVIGVYVAATDVFSVSEFYRYSNTAVGVVMYNSHTEARSAAVQVTVLFKKNS